MNHKYTFYLPWYTKVQAKSILKINFDFWIFFFASHFFSNKSIVYLKKKCETKKKIQRSKLIFNMDFAWTFVYLLDIDSEKTAHRGDSPLIKCSISSGLSQVRMIDMFSSGCRMIWCFWISPYPRKRKRFRVTFLNEPWGLSN